MNGNYIPLYRKYRPQTLETLVGQEHIKKALTSAIELDKISHAFLFTGPRGTGKTSTARILAKSLNCVNGPTITPCGKCESCLDIINSVPIDVIEIDAASNRSVEDAQNILEKIQYAPIHGRYKIYIIDEVHMLSTTAFNALLKTLEEPPKNVIFILATTEVHKVLDTIKSRCQRYDFRRITTEDIVKHLRYIAENENIKISDDALLTIAKNSAGGMRDSISLLDQLSLLGMKDEITPDDVNAILGRLSFDLLNKLSNAIISSSPNEAIKILNDIYNSGNEPLQILTNLSEYFKNLLIIKTCKNDLFSELTGLNELQINELCKQKDLLEVQQIVFLLERIVHYTKEVKASANQYLWLEVSMIDFSNMTENTKLIDLQERIKALENGVSITPAVITKTVAPAVIPSAQQVTNNQKINAESANKQETTQKIEENSNTSDEEFTPPPISKKSDGMDLHSLWDALLANIKSAPAKALLKQMGTPVKISADEIIITFKSENFVSQYTNTNKKDLLVDSARILFNNAKTKITVRLPKSGDEKLSETVTNTIEEKKKIIKINTDENGNINIETKKVALEENINAPKTAENELEKEKKTDKRLESDQEKMILDLFDGKYID